MKRLLVFLGMLVLVPEAAEAQDRANPLSACFVVVFAEPTGVGEYSVEREVVEFIFDPANAWLHGFERAWRLEAPPRRDAVAVWRIEGQELVAIWAREEDVLSLRLTAIGEELQGEAFDALEPAVRRGSIRAVPTHC